MNPGDSIEFETDSLRTLGGEAPSCAFVQAFLSPAD